MPHNTSAAPSSCGCSWVCYYCCTRCRHTWRSPSTSFLAERKLCRDCKTAVSPFDRVERWPRGFYVKVNARHIEISFDPALLQHGLFDQVALSGYNYDAQLSSTKIELEHKLELHKSEFSEARGQGSQAVQQRRSSFGDSKSCEAELSNLAETLGKEFNAKFAKKLCRDLANAKYEEGWIAKVMSQTTFKSQLAQLQRISGVYPVLANPTSTTTSDDNETAENQNSEATLKWPWPCSNSMPFMFRMCLSWQGKRVTSAVLHVFAPPTQEKYGPRSPAHQENQFKVNWESNPRERLPRARPQFFQILADKVNWGVLLTYNSSNEHQGEFCEKCNFYGSPCRMQVTACVDSTKLKLTDLCEETTEQALSTLFELNQLTIKEVLIGMEDDVNVYLRGITESPAHRQEIASQVRLRALCHQVKRIDKEFVELRRKFRSSQRRTSSRDRSQQSDEENQQEQEQINLVQMKLRHKEERLKALEELLPPGTFRGNYISDLDHGCYSDEGTWLESPTFFWLQSPLPEICSRVGILEFDNAEWTRDALEHLSQLRAGQQGFEEHFLQVGLSKKQWINWHSIMFTQELQLTRKHKGPLRSALQSLVNSWCFGEVQANGPNTFRLVMVSLPHWLRQAVEKVHQLADLLGTFSITDAGKVFHVIRPEQVFDLGYVAEPLIDNVMIPRSSWNAIEPADAAEDGTTLISAEPVFAGEPYNESAFSGTQSQGMFHLALDQQDVEQSFADIVEQVCGICNMAELKLFLQNFYKKTGDNPLLPGASTRSALTPDGEAVALPSAELEQDPQMLATALDSDSEVSHASHSSLLSSAKCFLFDTLLRCPNGLTTVQALSRGDTVLGSKGEALRVTSCSRHTSQKLVEIHAGSKSLSVTDSHRIMVVKGATEECAPADSLREGHSVICDDGVQQVTSVVNHTLERQVIKLILFPDLPVLAHVLPNGGILSKGARKAPGGGSRAARQRRQHEQAGNGATGSADPYPNTDSDYGYPLQAGSHATGSDNPHRNTDSDHGYHLHE